MTDQGQLPARLQDRLPALWREFSASVSLRSALATREVTADSELSRAGKETREEVVSALSGSGAESTKVLTSISHSAGWAVCLGCVPREERLVGVGLDLERSDRVVHPKVLSRIVSPEEAVWLEGGAKAGAGLGVLDFWVMKEAAYKANPNSEGSVVSQYRLVSFESETGLGLLKRAGDPFRFQVKLLREAGWCVALVLAFDR